MKSETLMNSLQIVAGIAVLVGLGLVIVELRQTRTLMRVQITSEGYSDHLAYHLQLMGENPSPILAKACRHPEQLTEGELNVISAWMDYRYAMATRSRTLEEIGGFGMSWREAAEGHLRHILATPIGRVDFEKNKELTYYFDPAIVEVAQDLLDSGSIRPCGDWYMGWMEGLPND